MFFIKHRAIAKDWNILEEELFSHLTVKFRIIIHFKEDIPKILPIMQKKFPIRNSYPHNRNLEAIVISCGCIKINDSKFSTRLLYQLMSNVYMDSQEKLTANLNTKQT